MMMIDLINFSKKFTTKHTNRTFGTHTKSEEKCIAINNNLPYTDNMSLSLENRRLIFRLAVVLYLVFLLKPGFFAQKQQIRDSENGIGGGNFNNEDISLTLASLSDASFEMAAPETAALEPESLSKTRVLLYDTHKVTSGENISTLAINMGLNQGTIISVNKITNTRLLQIGKVLRIPNQDGILHAVRSGDTLSSIAEKYKAEPEAIITANELFSDKIRTGTDLFIPGAKLDWVSLQEINGDLFIWPLNGVITSPYGYRKDPFSGNRVQFHTGIDIRGNTGTPVRAAMSGRVSSAGYDAVFGNYVIISHHSGYRTLYGHLSVIRTRNGAYVGTGERIGDVGSTGLSTGPHLHFMVYKNGVTVNPRSLIK
jgi:murein DD-endopeptidase MepM/ murein hydrolase activator NlpD